jgi:methionyl aminopeptidase
MLHLALRKARHWPSRDFVTIYTAKITGAYPVQDTRGRLTKEGIRIYEEADFIGMQAAGHLAARILDEVAQLVAPGVTTEAIDDFITTRVRELGAVSATIGYRGYQHASCISVNHVVCHGIPGPKVLKDGDILNVDVTLILEGWYGDTSRMYVAGSLSRKAERLIEVTHDALMLGISAVKPGNTFGDIGHAIQTHVEANRMSVVRDFCGHGLGRVFHAPPNVLHYGRPGSGPVLEEGMFFTIEPMVNLGRPETKVLADDWTAVTRDKSLSAQFEHSVGVTATGCEIFTLSPAGRFHPTWG